MCGTALNSFTKVVGKDVCCKCLDGEGAGMKAARVAARMLGFIIFMAGLSASDDSHTSAQMIIGVVLLVLGILALIFGFRSPKPAPGSLAYNAPALEHNLWFAKIADLTEEKIRKIPMQATNGFLLTRAMIILIATFLGASGGFGVSFACCFLGLVITKPVMSRATPLDRARWKRFWNGFVLAYWVMFFLVLFLFTGPRGFDNPFVLPFIFGCIAGLVTGFTNVKIRDNQDKEVCIGYFRKSKETGPLEGGGQL